MSRGVVDFCQRGAHGAEMKEANRGYINPNETNDMKNERKRDERQEKATPEKEDTPTVVQEQTLHDVTCHTRGAQEAKMQVQKEGEKRAAFGGRSHACLRTLLSSRGRQARKRPACRRCSVGAQDHQQPTLHRLQRPRPQVRLPPLRPESAPQTCA